MLGRLRRTTRLDVGLALAFSGLTYLVWVLVSGIARETVQMLINTIALTDIELPASTAFVKLLFVDAGIVIDLVGLAWLAGSLLLVVFSSRQHFSISWAWVCAMFQSFVAAIGAVLVGWAVQQPYYRIIKPMHDAPVKPSLMETVSGMSLWVVLAIAVVLWVGFLVWLLFEAYHSEHGPSLKDGLRSNVYR